MIAGFDLAVDNLAILLRLPLHFGDGILLENFGLDVGNLVAGQPEIYLHSVLVLAVDGNTVAANELSTPRIVIQIEIFRPELGMISEPFLKKAEVLPRQIHGLNA